MAMNQYYVCIEVVRVDVRTQRLGGGYTDKCIIIEARNEESARKKARRACLPHEEVAGITKKIKGLFMAVGEEGKGTIGYVPCKNPSSDG